jgi:hypothetical protein
MHLDLGRAARRAGMSQRMLRCYLRPAAALLGATTTAVEQALLSAAWLS